MANEVETMRTINCEKIEIINLNSLATSIGKYDTAAPTDILWGNKQTPQDAKDFMGVVNMNTGKLVMIPSAGYQIIQHNDCIQAVTETLGRLNMDVKGRVNNYNDRIVADLVFQTNGKELMDDSEGIMLGIRVVNSYNRSSSFRLEMFGFRRICQNGMTFGAKSFGVVESTIHYGSKEKNLAAISRITERFIARVIDSSEAMQGYINAMIQDSLEYNMAKRIIAQMVGKKHYNEILTRLSECRTRWDMYNALTNYATHGEHLTPNVREHIEKLSRKVMETSIGTLITDTIELEQEAQVSI